MKAVAAVVSAMNQTQIGALEKAGTATIELDGSTAEILLSDVDITSQDIPGWLVTSEGGISVALDITISESLKEEGIAREIVNRIQNFRKESGLEVTDRIALFIKRNADVHDAVQNNLEYICQETLAGGMEWVDTLENGHLIEVDEQVSTEIAIEIMK